MTYAELIEAVALQQCLTKKGTRGIIEAFIAQLSAAVWESGRLVVPGLGTFNVRRRKARRVSHPMTELPMRLPARRVVTCRVSSTWRAR